MGRIEDWLAVLVAAVRRLIEDDGVGLAKQIAYSTLLAFFPTAVLVLGLLGLTGTYDDLRSFLAPVAPEAVLETVEELRDRTGAFGSTFAVIAGAAGALWAASGAMSSVVKAVNAAEGLDEERPFWRLRLVSLGLVVLGGIVAALLLLVVVLGRPLGEAIAEQVGADGAFDVVWAVVRWPLAFGAVLVFLALLYRFAPTGDRPWRWVSPGSLLAGLTWVVLSTGLGLYATASDTYQRTYGSLAAGIILLLWLWLSAIALLLGAELNAELERRAQEPGRELSRRSPHRASTMRADHRRT